MSEDGLNTHNKDLGMLVNIFLTNVVAFYAVILSLSKLLHQIYRGVRILRIGAVLAEGDRVN